VCCDYGIHQIGTGQLKSASLACRQGLGLDGSIGR
jgi:hypothetical protein